MLHFIFYIYFIILENNLFGLTFNMVSLRKPDMHVSRVFSTPFGLFLRRRSMQDELLKFLKQKGSAFGPLN